MGLTAASYEHPVTLLFARPLPAALAAWQERGRPLVTVALARNGPKGHERYKAHSFLNNLLARRELGEGDAEGLMRTTDGRVARESSATSFSCGATSWLPWPSRRASYPV
jgi:Branched-chain amino acid aminotransferase/4-amino-4-deoxychorismate lyase